MALRIRNAGRYNSGSMIPNELIPNAADQWTPGTTLPDNCRIVRRLGQGGMGTVYLVERPVYRAVPLYYAVKIVRRKFGGNDEREEHFVRELRNWISLPEHPHVVTCMFFKTIRERLAIFSEFIDGCSMSDAVSGKRIGSRKELWDLAIQSAWGLAAAHACGVLHLDIKPSNLLIRHDGLLKITDFGLSLGPADQPDPNTDGKGSSAHTSHGLTPAFASPEQAYGRPMGPAADQWSWAVSMLYGFSGSLTWKLGVTASAVLKKLTSRSLKDMIPECVCGVLERCFREDPEDRWPDMIELARELVSGYQRFFGESYRRREPSVERQDKEPETGGSPQTDYSAMLMEIAGTWREKRPGDYQELESACPVRKGSMKTRLLVDLATARHVSAFLRKMPGQDDPAIVKDQIKTGMLHAAVCRQLGDLPGSVATIEEALRLHTAMQARLSQADWLETGINLKSSLSTVLIMSHRFEDALRTGREVETMILSRPGDQLNLVRNKLSLMATLGRMHRLNESLEEAEEAIRILENRKLVPENAESLKLLAASITNRAATLGYLDRDGEAAREFARAADLIRILMKRHGVQNMHHRFVQVCIDGAHAWACSGDFEKAEQMCRKAVDVLAKIRPAEQQWVRLGRIRATEVLIQVLHQKGKSAKALRKLDSLTEVMEREIYSQGDTNLYRNLSALLEARRLITESLNDQDSVEITREWQRNLDKEIIAVFGEAPARRDNP